MVKDDLGRAGWDTHYKRVNSSLDFEFFREYNTQGPYVKRMLKFAKKSTSSLEFGSGKGGLSLILKREFPQIDIHLLDLDEDAINYSKKLYNYYNLNAKFFVNSFLDLPFEDESFDFIHGNTVLEHVPNTSKAISELTRVLKKDGHILVTVPNSFRRFDGNDLYHTIYRLNYYNRTFFPKELKKLFIDNSCKISDFFGTGFVYHYPSYMPRYIIEKIRLWKKSIRRNQNQETAQRKNDSQQNSIYGNKEVKLYNSTFSRLDDFWDPIQKKLNNYVNSHESLPSWMNLVIGVVAKKL